MTAQAFDDLQTLGHRGTQVLRAAHRVAVIEIVGAHPDAQQGLHQGTHRHDIVIDAAQQHGLVVEWNSGAHQAPARRRSLARDFARMVEVGVDPQGAVRLQRVAQLRRDALGQRDRHARADADDLEMRNRTQAVEQIDQPRRPQVSGSPPETTTSRIAGVAAMYSIMRSGPAARPARRLLP